MSLKSIWFRRASQPRAIYKYATENETDGSSLVSSYQMLVFGVGIVYVPKKQVIFVEV